MNTEKDIQKKCVPNPVQKYRLLACTFALITVLAFCYTFGVFDSLTAHVLSDPKDYKTEEIANAEEARLKGMTKFDKLVDENAEQFINEVVEEVVDTASIDEPVLLEPEPEPVGEEF
ncbi:MAG: hypothetical protein MJZ83_02310 [Bacteroidaceae bacterium]|nr:hypothetical protein [Bacteroidaceae bacterium]